MLSAVSGQLRRQFHLLEQRGYRIIASPERPMFACSLHVSQGLPTTTVIRRTIHVTPTLWKNEARKGKQLETLNEMAHATSRKEARERRKKKKGKDGDEKAPDNSATSKDSSTTNELVEIDDNLDDIEEEEDVTVLPDSAQVQERMHKVLDLFEHNLKSIRGSEPTPEMFDDIFVEAYGSSRTPLNSVAQVVISSSTLAHATCYDPDLAKNVSAAIRDKLELNPSVEEGGVVKIPLPRVSLEVREQTAKSLAQRTEKYRQRIRTIRRNVLKIAKQGEAGKLEGVSKDDAFRSHKEIEATTEKVMARLNETFEKKQKSIMEV